jgi:hypothetical protein
MENLAPAHESTGQLHERITAHVISYVTSKIELAAEMFQKGRVDGESADIVEYLQKVWPENDGAPWQRRPRFTVPDLEEPILIRFEPHTTEYDSASRTISIAVGELRKASTAEEFERALVQMMQSVYHEAEHIFIPGQELDTGEGVRGTIEYLCNEGEIAAYARQFSYRYKKEFQDQPFNLELMQQLAVKLKDVEGNNNAYYYFVLFLDSARQEKYRLYGDVLKAHERIVERVKMLVA